MGVARGVVGLSLLVMGCSAAAEQETAPGSALTATAYTPSSVETRQHRAGGTTFAVLDFNIGMNGYRGLDGVAAVIRATNPDAASLQECDAATAASLAQKLGWSAVTDDARMLAILSPHPITLIGKTEGAEAWGALGATITIGGPSDRGHRQAHVFDLHLDWQEYGPYFLDQGQSKEFVVAAERTYRLPTLDKVLAWMKPKIASGDPTFLTGDFNAPSHEDYDGLPWPTSTACVAAGLADSYRAVHPREKVAPFGANDPGVTWSPLPGAETIAFDRIDFIHYAKKNHTRAVSSMEVDARSGIDPWPSDHRAVYSLFELR